MAECSVAGCGKPGDESYFVGEPFERQLPVCEAHEAVLADEDQWFALPVTGDREAVVIRLGDDLPPRVMAVSAESGGGSAPGLVVHLTLLQSGSPTDLTVLMSHDEADVLAAVLQRR